MPSETELKEMAESVEALRGAIHKLGAASAKISAALRPILEMLMKQNALHEFEEAVNAITIETDAILKTMPGAKEKRKPKAKPRGKKGGRPRTVPLGPKRRPGRPKKTTEKDP